MKLRINEGPSEQCVDPWLYKENQISRANTRSNRDILEIHSEFRNFSTAVFVDNSVSEDSVGETSNRCKISTRKVIGSIGIILIVAGCLILGMSPSHEDEKFNDETDHKAKGLKHTVIFDNGNDYYPIPNSCEADEYRIAVQMSGNLYSGTDDKVKIRLHGKNGEKTEWFELTNGSKNNKLERLSSDVFCAKFKKQPGLLEKIGIQKFGSDRMMIDIIFVQINHREMVFQQRQLAKSRRWIKTDAKEYIFHSVDDSE